MIMVIDRNTKLAESIPTTEASAARLAPIFFEQWVANQGIKSNRVTNYGPVFVPKFFVTVGHSYVE